MPSRDFCTFTPKRPNVQAVFEIDPEILHTCSMCPCQAFHEKKIAGNVRSLKTQLSQKKAKTQISGRKKKKCRKRLGRAGAHETRVQNFRAYLSKTAWTLDSEGIWGYMPNQPVAR